jgi:carboxylesterase
VHGYTGAPSNVRWLGDYLNAQGYTVYAPRLTGHGARPEDMRGVRWEAWYFDVLAAYQMLRKTCDQVYAVGLSMGAILSLLLASREAVDGVIAMSTPYELRDWRVRLLRLISMVSPVRRKPLTDEFTAFFHRVEEQKSVRGGEAGYGSYMEYPTSSVIQLNRLLAAMRAGLPQVTAPVLLIHSRRDEVVPFASMGMVAARLVSTQVQTCVVDESHHVICMDHECDRVFAAAADFIAAHSRGDAS